MKKYLTHILLASIIAPSFAYAEEPSQAQTPSTSVKVEEVVIPETPEQLFTTCSQDAIESRDTKLTQARTTYNNAINKALNDRKNEEKAAVAIKNDKEKKEAIKESVDTYKAQIKTIQNTLTSARKTVWQNFENDVKTCRELYSTDNKEKSDNEAKSIEEKKETPEPKTMKESFLGSIKSLFGKE